MKFALKVFVASLALCSGICTYAIDLVKGDFRVDKSFSDQETAIELIKAGAIGLNGYVRLPENEFYYVLIDLNLGKIKLNPSSYMGGWPIARWQGELTQRTVSVYDIGEGSERYGGQYWKEYSHNPSSEPKTLGCLAKSPLRYGDIESNGNKSLVLYLGRDALSLDWVMFSPELERIVFSARLALQDYAKVSEGDRHTKTQYRSAENQLLGYPGRRIYAKLYLDDFSRDGKFDIVVWRKRYVSRGRDDSTEGFYLDEELLNHYSLSENGYELQSTGEDIIRGWLSANELTWQKGYPSKSECAGAEGELIPEMHDPLLNDPDVLQ